MLDITSGKHQTQKLLIENKTYYITTTNNHVLAFVELTKTSCGNFYVSSSTSHISRLGYGTALYTLAMKDVYPSGIMPDRESISGHAVSLWEKLSNNENIQQKPIVNKDSYSECFDEWFDEIDKINPQITTDELDDHFSDYSFFDAVAKGIVNPHPYNRTYHIKPTDDFKHIPTSNNKELIEQANALFNLRYDNIDS